MFAIKYWPDNNEILESNYIYYPEDSKYTATNMSLILEFNKAGSLTFSLPITNPFSKTLKILKSTLSVFYIPNKNVANEYEIWRGRIISIDRDLFNNKSYTCEGALNFLNDITLIPLLSSEIVEDEDGNQTVEITEDSEYYNSVESYLSMLIDTYNSRVKDPRRQIASVSTEFEKTYGVDIMRSDYNTILYEINDQLISGNEYEFGGFLEMSYLKNGDMELDYHLEVTDLTDGSENYKIEFGSNLLDFTETIDGADVFTVIRYTDKNHEEDVPNPCRRRIENTLGVAMFGVIERAISIDTGGYTTFDKMDDLAEKYLNEHVKETFSIEISAIDLGILKGLNSTYLNVGTIIEIVAPEYDFDEKMTCLKISYDLSNIANTRYTFGSIPPTLTGQTTFLFNNRITDATNIF